MYSAPIISCMDANIIASLFCIKSCTDESGGDSHANGTVCNNISQSKGL